ncbi:nuclear pore complex protein [Ceratobasidium sp. AG-Ba]|nr:nuclear pore complex protein [Ceratobasidium sp. AG-Ba]
MGPEAWLDSLSSHDVFKPTATSSSALTADTSLLQVDELRNNNSLVLRPDEESEDDEELLVQRKNIMCIRGPDLFLAAGRQIRMLPLREIKESEADEDVPYKTLSTPNVTFDIEQLVVNPTGKLLAVVGTRQIAVVVLPRSGMSKSSSARLECSSIQIGEYYHIPGSPRITKVDWHPWGEGGASVLVLTSDGQLREYDVAKDPGEPQQTVDLLRPAESKLKFDASGSAQAVSFCIGQGAADWSPLTVYTLTNEGEVWAICPFLPANATPPISYVHALEYFVNMKSSRLPSAVADAQLKYVASLKQQLKAPSSPLIGQTPTTCLIHAPVSASYPPALQGPFLLQPAPKEFGDGTASDIAYLRVDVEIEATAKGSQSSESDSVSLVLIAYGDGKVDICLDVEKVEAKWMKANTFSSEESELPMLAVYESINLGLFESPKNGVTSTALTLARALAAPAPPQPVHPTFILDPLRADRVFVTHFRGVHRLDMRRWTLNVAKALKGTNQELMDALRVDKESNLTEVRWLSRAENGAIIGASVLNDVYLAYTLLVLDSTNALSSFELAATPTVAPAPRFSRKFIAAPPASTSRPPDPPAFVPFAPAQPVQTSAPKTYTCLLSSPFTAPPIPQYKPLSKPLSAPTTPTADTLRTLGKHAERLRVDMGSLRVAHTTLLERTNLQGNELQRQVDRLGEMLRAVGRIRDAANSTADRVRRAAERQAEMAQRADAMLRRVVEAEGAEGSSEAQAAWAKELARMRAEVRGTNGSTGLKGRSEQVMHQLELLKPTLNQISRSNERKEENPLGLVGLGNSQWLAIGSVIGAEQKSLEDARRKITELTNRLAEATIS